MCLMNSIPNAHLYNNGTKSLASSHVELYNMLAPNRLQFGTLDIRHQNLCEYVTVQVSPGERCTHQYFCIQPSTYDSANDPVVILFAERQMVPLGASRNNPAHEAFMKLFTTSPVCRNCH